MSMGDALFAGITTDAARLIDPDAYISPVDNYYFVACSVFVLAIVGTLIIDKISGAKASAHPTDGQKF